MTEEFIWDFDGMLFDTYPHTVAAFCETMKRIGRSIDPAEARKQLKITIRDAFDFYSLDESTKESFYLVENDMDFQPVGVPYAGIPELLRFIAENGGRNYLFTHRDRVALLYLGKYSLTSYFTDFVTREHGFPFKPSPEGLEYLVEKHSLDKDSCMMLGDRPLDVGAGVNAGIKTCLFDETGELRDVVSDYYCRTISEVARAAAAELGAPLG